MNHETFADLPEKRLCSYLVWSCECEAGAAAATLPPCRENLSENGVSHKEAGIRDMKRKTDSF